MRMIQAGGPLGLAFLTFLENVFPPIPSELIMPLAGYMVTREELSFLAVVLAGTIGSILGALPLYWLGRKVGEERLKELADRHGRWLTVSWRDIKKAQRWFERHGGAAVFFCRLIPGIRSLISLPAGVARMNLAVFLLWTTVGSALWTAVLAWVGYFLGGRFKIVGEYLNPASNVVVGGIVAWYLWRVIRHKGERTV